MGIYGYGGSGGSGNSKRGAPVSGGNGGTASNPNGENGNVGNQYGSPGGGGGGGAIGGSGGSGGIDGRGYYAGGGGGAPYGGNGGYGINGSFAAGGGGGGAGGSNGGSGTLSNTGALSGTAGGAGGAGGGANPGGYSAGAGGGGGGAGGDGFVVNVANSANTNSGTITGAAGGAGGYTHSANASGQGGQGGSGGVSVGVVAAATGSSLVNSSGSTITGGAGGAGGSVGYRGFGGSGAVGGNGVEFDASSGTLTNSGTITGGAGGAGANPGGGAGDAPGAGSAGGTGVTMGSGGTIVNNAGGAITGGNGGAAGAAGYGGVTANAGVGGAGIVGSGLTLVNSGTISGGVSGDTTPVQADAVTFTGGSNTLALGSNASFGGAIDVQNTSVVTFEQSAGPGLSPDATLNAPIIGSGSVVKDGAGTLTLTGANTYTGGTTIDGGTLVDAPTSAAASGIGTGAVTFAGTAASPSTLALSANAQPISGSTFTNTLTNFAGSDELDLQGLAYTGTTASTSITTANNSLTVTEGATTESFSLSGTEAPTYYAESDGNGGTLIVCFRSGTYISTARGDVAVEDLAIGDLVVTATGEHRPIRWLGHRTYDCRRRPGPRASWPVRVAAHAFGANLPSADLYLSPGHSVCVSLISEVLIPIQELVNGSTIAYAPVDTVTYWHVELDSHDILIANGLPAESFLEMGANRALLSNAAAADLPIEVLDRTHADFCRRFVDGGPLLAAAREELRRRSGELGWTSSRAVEIVGLVGMRRVKPLMLDGEAIFTLPSAAGPVAIRSCMTTPQLLGEVDPRRLGLAVYGLTLVTDAGEAHALDLDAPELRACFHEGERHEGLHYRWMRGDLVLPEALLQSHGGQLMLRLTFEPSTIRGWVAPAPLAEPAVARPGLRVVA